MRLNLIQFGVPGPLSGNIYTYEGTVVPDSVELKLVDIRETSDLQDFTIGKCKLEKDADGIWITGINSWIEITGDLLSKSGDRYCMASFGTVDDVKVVEFAEVKFVYISVEEDIKPLIRDLKLSRIGL